MLCYYQDHFVASIGIKNMLKELRKEIYNYIEQQMVIKEKESVIIDNEKEGKYDNDPNWFAKAISCRGMNAGRLVKHTQAKE